MFVSHLRDNSINGVALSPAVGALIAGAGMVSLLATYWDDAWHTELGRDSATIPPHLLLYGSVAVAGLMVAGWGLRVLVATRSPRVLLRQPPVVLAGVGGVATLAAAPIDAAWHAQFGRDAVLWSPPHMLVVFAATTMTIGVLSGLRPTRSGVTESALTGLLLGGLMVAVMEYESDVPQFSEIFYLPVLLVAGLLAALLARRLVPVRAPVTAMVASYVGLRLVIAGALALLGRSGPDLPIAIVGLALVDLPWRSPLPRYGAGAAAVAMLAWGAAALGLGREPASAVAMVAAPVAVICAVALLASSRRTRPIAYLAVITAASAGLLLGSALPAAAHDPGQGQPLSTPRLTGTSDGHGTLTLSLDLAGGCDQISAVGLLARRAGQTITGPLTALGGCRYAGTVAVPAQGRWFVYAELRDHARPAETWLPLQADQPGGRTETRELYLPAWPTATGRPTEIGTGAAIYTLGLLLLALAIRHALRRAQPVPPGVTG